jgi:ferredoxin
MPLRIVVDYGRCETQAVCEGIAPDIFQIDDDDIMHVVKEFPTDEDLPRVRAAIDSCPKQAISLVEE